MEKRLGILFIICAVLFGCTALFFLFVFLLALARPDLLAFNFSGYAATLLVSGVCAAFAYGLVVIGKRLRERD